MIGFQEEKVTYRDDIDTGIHRKQYFSYFKAICFIGGGNRRNQRKPVALSHNIISSTPRHERGSNSQL
jgi:hypothetical protein